MISPFRLAPHRVPVLVLGTAALLLPLLALLALGVVFSTTKSSQPAALDDYGEAPAFRLTDQLGRPVASEQFRGKAVLASFIYTSCQETCPLLSTQMQALQEHLRHERLLGRRVQLLSFTVDPTRDTVDVLRAHAARYQADPAAWRFLTGPEPEMRQLVVQGFKLGVQPVPLAAHAAQQGHDHTAGAHGASYDVMHSNRIVLIDPQGRIRAYYDGLALDAERTIRDIHSLLRG